MSLGDLPGLLIVFMSSQNTGAATRQVVNDTRIRWLLLLTGADSLSFPRKRSCW